MLAVFTVMTTVSLLSLPVVARSVQADGPLTLHGTVLDSTGHVLKGAFVQSAGAVTGTDASGHYQLAVPVTSTRVVVFAWAPGYQRMVVFYTQSDGGVITGDLTADFSGTFALQSAYSNSVDHAKLSGLPPVLRHQTHRVRLSGTASTPLESRLAVTLPTGTVKTYRLHVRGHQFWAVVPFAQDGAYWVEINAVSGFAVFNVLTFRGVPPAPPLCPYFPPEPLHATTEELEIYALYLINHLRETIGRPALVMQPLLLQAAQRHTTDMLRAHYYLIHPHIGSDGSTPDQRMLRTGLHLRASGEAIGEAGSVGGALARLLESPAHRGILLGHYRWAGIAVAEQQAQVYLTVDLAG